MDRDGAEYKRVLDVEIQSERFESLGSQLLYRLSKTGMTKYMLGVEDDGAHSMLTYSDMKRSFYCLKSLCDR
jgi:GTPase